MGSSARGQIETYRARLDNLIHLGRELREVLAVDPANPSAVASAPGSATVELRSTNCPEAARLIGSPDPPSNYFLGNFGVRGSGTQLWPLLTLISTLR